MLYIIGLGLDKNDISLKGISAVKKCKKVYLETYTNVMINDVKEIEKIIGKKIITSDRKMVEEGTEILNDAKKQNTALLVFGDPLAATTHVDLILRAREMKIKTKIIHSSSVFTAISETGLQLYKFGKTASIPKFQASFKPEGFYDIINENLKIDAHTLMLIDIGLSINEALGHIEDISSKRNDGLLKRKMIVCEQLGTDNQKITYDILSVLKKKKFKLPACIIIPAKLHFVEEETLKVL